MSYTTEECLQGYCLSLERQLAEKDAMIDWLAGRLIDGCLTSTTCKRCPLIKSCPKITVNDWRKAAQEAVKNKCLL